MNNKQNKFTGLCLAQNNYFAAIVCYINKAGNNLYLHVIVKRKDTWESYKSFSFQILDADIERKQWFEQAEKFITQLEKPEDWKRPYRFCLARYARQVLADNNFCENLTHSKEIDNEIKNIYIWHYNMGTRAQEIILIKKLNMLSDEEKKQLFILRDWEKEGFAHKDINNAIYGREYLYKRLYDRERFKDYYEKYNTELEHFKSKKEFKN
ncbi:hypothetical protein [Snodgrassella alvi]|jgi:hypothetical protein|uniref:Uncharacterized protein n=1 Tax=Snodgrassella alvi TaxID=1196083 RepID=A0A2N9Y052_9NEIS|nr:hypothetical protein [Snodgrassella alvi]PIT58128.1 hypothetical protein BHC49_02685 [Snodgrassella alvi]